jgi:hypothetical protein
MVDLTRDANRHSEERFARELHRFLSSQLNSDVKVGLKQNLLYTLVVDEKGKVRPTQDEMNDPKRGQLYAFQTDILIQNLDPPIPLVVLELKFSNFSTHDVITYSSKAIRHKEVFPYLRYGSVVGGSKSISKKFFIHNQGIDFAMSVFDLTTEGIRLLNLVTDQIQNAKTIMQLMSSNFTRFETKVVVELGAPSKLA